MPIPLHCSECHTPLRMKVDRAQCPCCDLWWVKVSEDWYPINETETVRVGGYSAEEQG